MRTFVYVDGFNLYYGAVKGTPFKWLNPVELARQLLPNHLNVEKVKYFTARVSGALDKDAPRRQQAYLDALATAPEIELVFGNFLSKTAWRPLSNLPVAGDTINCSPPVVLPGGDHKVLNKRVQTLPVGEYPAKAAQKKGAPPKPHPDALIAEIHLQEEKGSDVNIAAHLLNDAWKKAFDAAVVISNDTDLVTPIQMVSVERQKPVTVVCPGRWQMSPKLKRVATHSRHIHRRMLRDSQFPNPIPGTTIRKPLSW